MNNHLDLTPEFIAKIADELIENKAKEIKGKVKMAAWVIHQNLKLKEPEEYLISDLYDYPIKNDDGVVIKTLCVFIAVDSRDNSHLYSALLLPKFGHKLRQEMVVKRKNFVRNSKP